MEQAPKEGTGMITDEMVHAAAMVLNRRLAEGNGLHGVSRGMIAAAFTAASEPVAYGIFRDGEMVGYLPCQDLDDELRLPEDTDERRPLYLHPAPDITAAEERVRLAERKRIVSVINERMAVYQMKESKADCLDEPTFTNWDRYRYAREAHEWLLDAVTKDQKP